MIQSKSKICKGVGKTRGFGCGTLTLYRKYGLCPTCQYEWATSNDAGKVWFSKQLIQNKKKKEKEERKKHIQAKRELDDNGAMRLADMYFSRYIRLKHSSNEECTCYTCGKVEPIKEVDNGHYQKREHKATRYHENNCRPQCKTCNGDTKHNGKQDEFRVNLANEIGEENVSEIEILAKSTIKANTKFYRDIADEYREKLNALQKELKVKIW